MGLNNYHTAQTQKKRNGGCWIAAAAHTVKQIKAYSNAINWVKVEMNGNHIHVIGVYLTPGKKEAQEHNKEQLTHILGQLSKSPFGKQQIVVAGDFNEALPDVTRIAEGHGLTAVIPAGTATHWKGGHLDQVFTNMNFEGQEVSQVDKRLSDHRKITLRIRGTMEEPQYIAPTQRSMPTQAWVRRFANKEETIEKLLGRENITSTPLSTEMEPRPQARGHIWHREQTHKTQNNHAEFESMGTSMKKEEWAKTMKQLEYLHKQGEWKEFYQLVNKLTRIKQGSCLVQAVSKGDWVSTNDEERDGAIAEYMSQLYDGEELRYQEICEQKGELFTEAEVEDAIQKSNFNKAIGPDMFDGNALLKNETLRQRVAKEITGMLNKAKFPDHFREGRLTALSKKPGQSTVDLEDIRPIVIRSHLTKISEKAVLAKLLGEHKHLIKTAQSQTGFKKGCGTANNITRMLMAVHPGKGRKKKTAVLLVDLKKAYDSVNREKLLRILRSRCKNEEDKHLVDVIAELHGRAIITIGGKVVETKKGLAQGSVLAPLLFNVYLEEALKSASRSATKYRKGELACYADDLMCLISDEQEARSIIKELQQHLLEWDLKININKSEILGLMASKEIEGIGCRQMVKYLGMNIAIGANNQRRAATLQVERNLNCIKARLRGSNTALKETLLQAYSRSLLLYFGLPMNAAGIWKQEAIDRIETAQYRKIHGVPKDIKGQTLLNVTQGMTPASQIIAQRAAALRRTVNRDSTIAKEAKQEQHSQQAKERVKIYLPKEVANTMLALTRGRTVVYFGKRHQCGQHSCPIDDEHLRKCEAFADLPAVHDWVKKLRESNLREWEQPDLAAAIVSFTLLKVRLNELEGSGRITIRDIAKPGKENAHPEVEEVKIQSLEQQDTVMTEAAATGAIQVEKKKRGRPRKYPLNIEGQMPLSFYMKKPQNKNIQMNEGEKHNKVNIQLTNFQK